MCACSWRYRPVLFLRKIFRSDGGICVSITPFWIFGPFGGYVTETHISPSDRIFFSKKKYVAISPRSGAYVGERNLLLSVINRRFKKWSKTGSGPKQVLGRWSMHGHCQLGKCLLIVRSSRVCSSSGCHDRKEKSLKYIVDIVEVA